MELVLKLIVTVALIPGIAWALLTGGFGLINFKDDHGPVFGMFASLCWLTLVLIHPFAFYQIWFVSISFIWLLPVILLLHILFFKTIGKNVSTR